MNFHITHNSKTNLYDLQITKMDPIEYNTEIVVGEFFDITLDKVTKIMSQAEMILAFGYEFIESLDKGRLREY